MKINKATVMTHPNRPDYVILDTDLPDPFPGQEGRFSNLHLTFQTQAGSGAEYVKANFGLEAEVISRCNYFGSQF